MQKLCLIKEDPNGGWILAQTRHIGTLGCVLALWPQWRDNIWEHMCSVLQATGELRKPDGRSSAPQMYRIIHQTIVNALYKQPWVGLEWLSWEGPVRAFLTQNVLYCQGRHSSIGQDYCFSRLTSPVFLFFNKTSYMDLYKIYKSIARQIGMCA